MAMFYWAYFDASGKKESHTAITVAGAVAPVKKWTKFVTDWKKVLDDERVSEFHATDFAASLGEYTGWKGDRPRRSGFLKRLGRIVKSSTNKFFIVTVEMDAWRSVNGEYMLAEFFHSPYALAGYSVVHMVKKWANRKKIRSPLEFIFEDGDEEEDWRGLKKLCREINVVPSRLPKSKAIPCQVGDWVAWKTRIASQNALRINQKMNPLQFSPDLLNQTIQELESLDTVLVKPTSNAIYSTDALVRTCVKSKVPKRSAVHLAIGGLPISKSDPSPIFRTSLAANNRNLLPNPSHPPIRTKRQ